jgi:fibro-slime domain-containing protein
MPAAGDSPSDAMPEVTTSPATVDTGASEAPATGAGEPSTEATEDETTSTTTPQDPPDQTSAAPATGASDATSTTTTVTTTSSDSTDPEDVGLIVEEGDVLVVEAMDEVPPDDSDCDNILEVTYRDFTTEHVDFEMEFQGDVVRLGLLEETLDPDGKPVFLDSIGCPQDNDIPQTCNTGYNPDTVAITSAESFDQWYRTVDGVNMEFHKELELAETPPGSGVYVFESDMFFPLGDDEGFGKTPETAFANFLFTTEIHLLFTYVAEQTFTFRGDDDLWIFINDKLALDLGSMHNVEEGTIDFDAQAADLGITPGSIYSMDVFHAERHTFASNFRIETNIGCFRPNPARVR